MTPPPPWWRRVAGLQVRCAGAVWLVSLLLYTGHHPRLMALLPQVRGPHPTPLAAATCMQLLPVSFLVAPLTAPVAAPCSTAP